jgi:hypothetical protein
MTSPTFFHEYQKTHGCRDKIPTFLTGEEWDQLLVEGCSEYDADILGSLFAPFGPTACESGFPLGVDGPIMFPAVSEHKERATGVAPMLGETSFRLRPRGRATQALASAAVVNGWWRDLPGATPAAAAVSWLSTWSSGEVKVGKARPIQLNVEGESASAVSVHLPNGRYAGQALWLCPELVASLVCSRALRGVDSGLLQSLRSRARLWAKERGMSDLDLSFIISGSVVFAALPQRQEVAAVSLLRTDAARWSSQVLGSLAKGRVQSGMTLSFRESLGRVFRWSAPVSPLQPTTSTLVMSA